jgi:2-dehydro-3-deoxygluconokinase
MGDERGVEVVALGEALIRLSVPCGERLQSASRLHVHPAGAEANMAVALSSLGAACAWVGALPRNPMGLRVASRLRAAGVHLEGVVWFEKGRIGTYFVELSAPPRPVRGLYDRADSCAARLTAEQVDWDHLMSGRILHLTGITPALSVSCREIVSRAVDQARRRKVPICFDVNYREGLWSFEEARTTLTPLIQESEILICGRDDACRVFGLEGDDGEIIRNLVRLSRARRVVLSREADGILAWDGQAFIRQPALPVQVIDPIGAGDALAAGVLYGWLKGSFQEGVRVGAVLAALALTQHGDMLDTTPEEIYSLLEEGSGGIKR